MVAETRVPGTAASDETWSSGSRARRPTTTPVRSAGPGFLREVMLVGAATTVSKGMAFAILIAFAHVFAREEYGLVRYVLILGNLVSILPATGFPTAISRFMAANQDNPSRRAAYFSASLAATAAAFAATALLLAAWGAISASWIPLFVAAVVAGAVAHNVYAEYLRGYRIFGRYAAYQFLGNTFRLGALLGAAALVVGLRPEVGLVVYAFANLIPAALIEASRRRGSGTVLSLPTRRHLEEVVRFSLPVLVTATSGTLLLGIGLLTIEALNLGYGMVADYSIAMTLGESLLLVPTALFTIMMPAAAAETVASDTSRLREAVRLTVLVSSAVSLGLAAFQAPVIAALFGPQYLGAVAFLPVVLVGFFLYSLAVPFFAVWTGKGETKLPAIANLGGATVATSVTLAGVPALGAIGAAVGFTLGAASSLAVTLALWKTRSRRSAAGRRRRGGL